VVNNIKYNLLNAPCAINGIISFRSRCRFAKSDLQKGYAKAKLIDGKQRETIMKYWKPFLNNYFANRAFDIKWFDIYNFTNRNGYRIERYIPDGYYYSIVDPFLTNVVASSLMDDKNLYNLYFPDANQPRAIIHKINGLFLDENYHIISENDAINKCIINNVIIKPSVSTVQGKGIVTYNKHDDVEILKRVLKSSENIVVQEFI